MGRRRVFTESRFDMPCSPRRRLILSAAAAAPLVPLAARAQSTPAVPLPVPGSALPLAPIALLGGGRFEPAQADGRVLVLYWWASWCPFCALQSPEMQKLWAAAQPRGLQVLGLSIDRQPQDAATYLQRKGYSFPSAWVGPAPSGAYAKPEGLPVTVVRGRDGRVLQAEKGQLFPEDVAQLARWL